MQLKSNLNHVFTSFSTKPTNNYRIFCGNKQIQSKYIYRFYDIIISPSHHPQPSQKHRHPCAQSNPPKTSLSLEKRYHSWHMNALLVSHPCETLGVQLRASMPLYERSVGFAVLLPSTITLASPRKRGGGTADIIFWLAVQYSDSPAFTILKLFRAVTVGIAPHPHHQ